jgi:hypothetical protein
VTATDRTHRPATRLLKRDRTFSARNVLSVESPADPTTSEVLEVAILTRRIVAMAVELTMILPRSILEEFVERLLSRLDALDGDPDLEPDADFELEDI